MVEGMHTSERTDYKYILRYYTTKLLLLDNFSIPQLFAPLAVHPAVFFHRVTMLFAPLTDGTAESRSDYV